MARTYEHYFYDKVKGEKVETDMFEFTLEGEIISWSMWSSCLNEWVAMPLEYISKNWPSKMEKIEAEISERCVEILEDIAENYIDEDEAV